MATEMYHGILGDLARSRVDDFLREAEHEQLVRQAQAERQTVLAGLVERLADSLIAVGLSLKARRAAIAE